MVLILLGAERYIPEELLTSGWVGDVTREIRTLTGQRQKIPGKPLSGQLTVDFIDVGQGDCTLIMVDDHAMIFDCGPEDTGTYLQSYLRKQGISKLDYVIGSHPDADHIGGMDVIMTKFDCETIMMPDFEKSSSSVRGVEEALDYKGYRVTYPQPGEVYQLGGASFTILAPIWFYAGDANNNSIAIRLEYGSNSFLFTGDAETEEETDMTASGAILKSDVYQAGHHGSSDASSMRFLKAVRPEYAVISCGEDNDYGHPHRETLERFRQLGIQVFRTDEQGTIRVTSDGENLTWSTMSEELELAG